MPRGRLHRGPAWRRRRVQRHGGRGRHGGRRVPLLETQLHSDAGLDELLNEILDEGWVTSLATVESPIGPWDCLVHGRTVRDVEALVGTEVVLEEIRPDAK